jgi:Bacterial Ig domain/Calx-beta domain
MKAMRLYRVLARVSLIVGLLGVAFSPARVFSQTILTNFPTVTIRTLDPIAWWTGKTANFTVYRSGNLAPAVNVYYTISGTAANGVDYQMISSFIQIPSGAQASNIVIQPINLGQMDTKTVTLTLARSPVLTPGTVGINYLIGTPRTATVFITPPGQTSLPPTVTITSPTNGATFNAPADINLIAEASDSESPVTSVEFFAGTNEIGITTNWVVVDPLPQQPPPPVGTRAFMLEWTNVPGGIYPVTAVAKAGSGATNTSEPVDIIVQPVTQTNLPPVVRITSPPNRAIFRAPVTLPIFAYAHDPDGSIASVEFFDGTNALGFGNPIGPVPVATPLADAAAAYSTPVSPGPIPVLPIPIPPTNLFVYVWTNVPVGSHALTAVATDNGGASTTSDPVNITVLPGFPPPTNLDIVNIVATDPIAIEDTNSWPWLGVAGTGTPTWSNWTAATPLWCIFTNFGPKDAVFTVRRFGDVSSDLTVTYGIGGTASNGVDYVTLPGMVTIPAGEISTRITVVPINDGPTPDILSTVVLTLTPDTNMPPDYLIGIPRRAAAIILDGPPWPATAALPDKCFHMQATGPDGAWYHIEYSPDAVNWTPICTNQVICGSIDFVDPDAGNNGAGFYRAVPELNPPAF